MDLKDISIIRSRKRKTIALQVTADAEMIVRVPHRLSDIKIKEIIEEKKNWLEEKYQLALSRIKNNPRKRYVTGEDFLFLGKYYKLRMVEEQDEALKFSDGFLLLETERNNAALHFEKWYKKQALVKLEERVKHYADLTGIDHKRVKISTAEKRWGSCSARGNLNFNWRIILAPILVVDYIVVHELSHIEIKDHSRAFWDRARAIYPRLSEARAWLRQNGRGLNI